MLRSPTLSLSLYDAKEVLGAIVREKGWEEQTGTKAIYATIAKKTINIDRRKGTPSGGSLVFNI
jgi:hypothetical protein